MQSRGDFFMAIINYDSDSMRQDTKSTNLVRILAEATYVLLINLV